jgi:hypothetical protein
METGEPMTDEPREMRARPDDKSTAKRQTDVEKVGTLDLERAKNVLSEVLKEELESEVVSPEVLSFRMKHRS